MVFTRSETGMALPDTHNAYATELRAIEDYRRFSIITIQRFWRGCAVRQGLQRQREAAARQAADAAAVQLSAAVQYCAARAIQDAWRSRRNRRIFQQYKDLLGFKSSGDPKGMLRAINPREAALLDAAAGAHVRFRLGGSSFPPAVFYKLYTHRPVTDINAFAPRDYASEPPRPSANALIQHLHPGSAPTSLTIRRRRARLVASGRAARARSVAEAGTSSEGDEMRPYVRLDGSIGYRSTCGWYRRNDCNGWRPVAPQLLVELEDSQVAAQLHHVQVQMQQHAPAGFQARRVPPQRRKKHSLQLCTRPRMRLSGDGMGCKPSRLDEAAGEASAAVDSQLLSRRWKPVTHYSGVVRREERIRRTKRRRREWLLKLYRQWTAQPQAGGDCFSDLGASAAAAPGHGPPTGGGARGWLAARAPADGTAAGGTREVTASAASAASAAAGAAAVVHAEMSAGVQVPPAVDEEALLAELERRLQRLQGPCHGSRLLNEEDGEAVGGGGQADGRDEASALLQWCQALDFEAYASDWMAAACTLGSDADVDSAASKRKMVAEMVAARLEDAGVPDAAAAAATAAAAVAAAASGRWPAVMAFQGGAMPSEGVTSGLLVGSV